MADISQLAMALAAMMKQQPIPSMLADQGRFSDFRRSDNIEDRRKEHFQSFPQAPQMPNVFADNNGLMNLSPHTDFATAAPFAPNPLSDQLGAGTLDAWRNKYLADRGN